MDMNPIADGYCYNISKINLSLHIVCTNSVERIKQKSRIDTINTSINFSDLFLVQG